MSTGDQHSNGDPEEKEEKPLLILSPAGETISQNLGMGAGTVSGVPLMPEFVDANASSSENLASRIEQALAEDGRISALLGTVTAVADDKTGQVTLSGQSPDPDLLNTLLRIIRRIPGVTAVADETHPAGR